MRSHHLSGLLCLSLLTVAALVSAAPKPPPAPATYKGRTVAEWIAQLQGPDDKKHWPAILALKELGPAAKDAVPVLVEILRHDAEAPMRSGAANVLGEIGEDARAAIPALREAVKDKSEGVRNWAVEALENIGGEGTGVRALTNVLKDDRPELRGWAVEALKRFGPAAESAAPALRDLLKDADAEVRLQAAMTLAQIGVADERVVSILIESLPNLTRGGRGRLGPGADWYPCCPGSRCGVKAWKLKWTPRGCFGARVDGL